MNYRISERVGGFIIRRNTTNQYELLLFEHKECKEAPIQIPGGGVERGESIEEALYREIHEESGLTDLTLVRKLGVTERCWLDTQTISRRHYFLLEASHNTPDRWSHIVWGSGADTGLCFSYFWHRPTIDFALVGGAQNFLNRHHIPELYA